MTLWSKLVGLDGKLRRFVAIYIFIPLFGLSVPVGLYTLVHSSIDYRRLTERQVRTLAVIQTVTESGGRHNRNAVVSNFKAIDGRTYVTKALYALEASRHLRPGMQLGVVYERGAPSNNAPTLAYARARRRDAMLFLAIMSGIFALLTWIYRTEYAAICLRMRNRISSRSSPPGRVNLY